MNEHQMNDLADGHRDSVAAAIAALTVAATSTHTTPSGWQQRRDFAELDCHVLTSVAANVGGVEELLAVRAGSWESDLIRGAVHGTAGPDTWQLHARFRTVPIVLQVYPEAVFWDLGLTALCEHDRELAQAAFDDAVGAAATEAVAAGGMENEAVYTDQEQHAEEVLNRIQQLYEQDLAAYRDAYEQTVRAEVAARGITAAVRVDAEDEPSDDGFEVPAVFEELHAVARARTPLPAIGQAPDWTGGIPADAVRAAGRGYLDRARTEIEGGR